MNQAGLSYMITCSVVFVLNRWRGSRRKWQLKEKYEKRQKNEDICPFGI